MDVPLIHEIRCHNTFLVKFPRHFIEGGVWVNEVQHPDPNPEIPFAERCCSEPREAMEYFQNAMYRVRNKMIAFTGPWIN